MDMPLKVKFAFTILGLIALAFVAGLVWLFIVGGWPFAIAVFIFLGVVGVVLGITWCIIKIVDWF